MDRLLGVFFLFCSAEQTPATVERYRRVYEHLRLYLEPAATTTSIRNRPRSSPWNGSSGLTAHSSGCSEQKNSSLHSRGSFTGVALRTSTTGSPRSA